MIFGNRIAREGDILAIGNDASDTNLRGCEATMELLFCLAEKHVSDRGLVVIAGLLPDATKQGLGAASPTPTAAFGGLHYGFRALQA